MKIEVDKRYINAKGDIISINGFNKGDMYPYQDTKEKESYFSNGLYRYFDNQGENDLICEVVEGICDDYALGYITQKEFIEKHIEYWTINEQTNL